MASMLVFLCVSLLAFAAAWPTTYAPEDAELHFEQFIQKYERIYADENEKSIRFEIFKERLVQINELNEKSDHAVFGITQFSDISLEEFHQTHSCFKNSSASYLRYENDACQKLTDEDIKYNDAPESFDWRDHSAVTEVKNQRTCGSCYAFSAIGNIEGQYAIKHNSLISLSEQQIIDCDKANSGCHGGDMSVAMRSLIEQGGSLSEDDYPYINGTQTCHFDEHKVKVQLSDCRNYKLESQEKLKQLLYHNGPISIGIRGAGLMFYFEGIISDKICDLGPLSHGVLLVGYGSEGDVPYWIVKNSWGSGFGENGYFRMHRGNNAHSCGMMNDSMASAIVV